MKKIFILFLILITACNKEACFNDKRNEYVLLKLKNYVYILSGDIHYLEVNCDNYSPISTLDSIKVKKLKDVMKNKEYQTNHDYASCPVDFCIVKIDYGKVEDKIFLGCQGNMIYVLNGEYEEKIGLNDKGATQLQEIINSSVVRNNTLF